MEGYSKHCSFSSFGDAMNNKRFVDGLKHYLKDMLVVANYGTKVTYRFVHFIITNCVNCGDRLEGIEEQLTPATAKFKDKDGKETSVFNYFSSKYHYNSN
jgi:hypothetical protein